MSTQNQTLGPFKLVTVNTAPERAKRLIGRVVEDVKDKYTIIHAGNADSTPSLPFPSLPLPPSTPHRLPTVPQSPLHPHTDKPDQQQVREVVTREQPDVLFTASMWTPEQASAIHAEAKEIVGPRLKTFALPQGLQVQKGPDAVVEFIKENLPALLEG